MNRRVRLRRRHGPQKKLFHLSYEKEKMAKNLAKWKEAQKKFRLSDKHIQMARELGMNPDKFGSLNNHKQEGWKAPLSIFIENIYFKQFKRTEPKIIRSLNQLMDKKKGKKSTSGIINKTQ